MGGGQEGGRSDAPHERSRVGWASWRKRWLTLWRSSTRSERLPPPERPRTRAAEQELESMCGPVLQRLAGRLQRGAAGVPLLPVQEAAELLQRVRQLQLLRERLAQQLEASWRPG